MGFPSKKATGPKRRIGECHHAGMADGIQHVFISPTLGDIKDIGATLVHELVHTITPGAQHKGAFVVAMRAIGLAGKPTATHAGEDLEKKLTKISNDLTKSYGVFPHSVLTPHHETKQVGRMLLLVASECCGYKIRTTAKWIEEQGMPFCPHRVEFEKGY